LLRPRLLLIGRAHHHRNPGNPIDPDQGFGDLPQRVPLSLRNRNYYVALSRTIALIHSSNGANIYAGLPENVGNLSEAPDGINTDNPKSRILGLIMQYPVPSTSWLTHRYSELTKVIFYRFDHQIARFPGA
jgi:hypothetical protein